MSQSDLGRLDVVRGTRQYVGLTRWLLSMGWVLSGVGFLGPWIAHPTAALGLSGADMAEFAKFLPGALDGSLVLVRQSFYLPPFSVAASVALLISSTRLAYRRWFRVLGLLLASTLSLQLLPPAWSPSSLMTAEFRGQAFAVGICWLLLAGSWIWRRLPALLVGSVSTVLFAVSLALTIWQLLIALPAAAEIYNEALGIGWGFLLCAVGLSIGAVASALFALARPLRVTRRTNS